MSKDSPKVTLHMVSSLDGFIAKEDSAVDWLQSSDHYEKGRTLSDEEVIEYLKNIDCYVMGSRTYEHALELGWPYGDKPVVVLSSRDLSTNKENVEFYSGELNTLVNDRLKPRFKNIWMVGGAAVTRELIRTNLVDDIILSIMPVILGGGTLFFDFVGVERKLHIKDVTTYTDGMVELWYEVVRK